MSNRHDLNSRLTYKTKLGQGAYGFVGLFYDAVLRKDVAVKHIKKSMLTSERRKRRVMMEIEILTLFQHPNIPEFYEVVESQNSFYIIMEYVKGIELFDHVMSTGLIKERVARRFFRQIISALDYSHRNCIAHRDLKPENIIVRDDGVVKVIDFGLAGVIDEERLMSTACGSPAYVAPEIHYQRPYKGAQVDMWSLGIILFTMVSGGHPFLITPNDKRAELAERVKFGQPKQLHNASTGLVDLVMKMLVKDPEKRITLPEVMVHPWVLESEGPNDNYLPHRAPITTIEPRVFAVLARHELVTDEARARRHLLRNKHCLTTAAYHLVCEHRTLLEIEEAVLEAASSGAAVTTEVLACELVGPTGTTPQKDVAATVAAAAAAAAAAADAAAAAATPAAAPAATTNPAAGAVAAVRDSSSRLSGESDVALPRSPERERGKGDPARLPAIAPQSPPRADEPVEHQLRHRANTIAGSPQVWKATAAAEPSPEGPVQRRRRNAMRVDRDGAAAPESPQGRKRTAPAVTIPPPGFALAVAVPLETTPPASVVALTPNLTSTTPITTSTTTTAPAVQTPLVGLSAVTPTTNQHQHSTARSATTPMSDASSSTRVATATADASSRWLAEEPTVPAAVARAGRGSVSVSAPAAAAAADTAPPPPPGIGPRSTSLRAMDLADSNLVSPPQHEKRLSRRAATLGQLPLTTPNDAASTATATTTTTTTAVAAAAGTAPATASPPHTGRESQRSPLSPTSPTSPLSPSIMGAWPPTSPSLSGTSPTHTWPASPSGWGAASPTSSATVFPHPFTRVGSPPASPDWRSSSLLTPLSMLDNSGSEFPDLTSSAGASRRVSLSGRHGPSPLNPHSSSGRLPEFKGTRATSQPPPAREGTPPAPLPTMRSGSARRLDFGASPAREITPAPSSPGTERRSSRGTIDAPGSLLSRRLSSNSQNSPSPHGARAVTDTAAAPPIPQRSMHNEQQLVTRSLPRLAAVLEESPPTTTTSSRRPALGTLSPLRVDSPAPAPPPSAPLRSASDNPAKQSAEGTEVATRERRWSGPMGRVWSILKGKGTKKLRQVAPDKFSTYNTSNRSVEDIAAEILRTAAELGLELDHKPGHHTFKCSTRLRREEDHRLVDICFSIEICDVKGLHVRGLILKRHSGGSAEYGDVARQFLSRLHL